MVPLIHYEYELKEKPETVLSRINWAVERVEYKWYHYLFNFDTSPSTNRDWIGIVDENKLRFNLEEPPVLFKKKYILTVKGNIELKASRTNVKIKLGLDYFSVLSIPMLYLANAFIIYEWASSGLSKEYILPLVFFGLFAFIATFNIYRGIKRCEKKLDKLFAR